MKIAFIVPYPLGKAPSQRFRFEQQLPHFKQKGIEYSFYSFLSDKAFDSLYTKGNYFSKIFSIIISFSKRFFLMFSLSNYDTVFIHREASPIGPPIFEWFMAKVLKKDIVYDFDDAIWLQNTSEVNNIVSNLKWHNKVKSICRWANKVSCGNEYLANFAKQFNQKIFIIPTTVDTENSHNKTKNQQTEKIIVGWTGTHSTIKYLYSIENLLAEIQEKDRFEFVVISNKKPIFEKLQFRYVEWKKETEIDDLLQFNIGIMPLENNKWAKGKCGFKAIQYMSLGIPAIVSNVGVNSKIVSNKINGFVCDNNEEWKNAFSRLLTVETRVVYGKNAQNKVYDSYSTISQIENYFSLIFPEKRSN